MRWLWVVFFGLLATGAQAASFDCAKAATEIEHAICNSPELSQLDEDMAAAYKQVPQSNKYFASLRANQRDWLQNDRTADVQTFENRAMYLTAFASLATCLDASDTPQDCLTSERETLDTCMNAGQYSTYAMNTCSGAMAAAWDSILAVESGLQRQSLADDPETLDLYDAALAAFDAYRDAECGWRYSQYRDGTIRGQIWFGCYLDLTSRRVFATILDHQLF